MPIDIKTLADLSRLKLSAHDLKAYEQDVSRILNNFQMIQDLDTSQTPTADASGLYNVSRSDSAQPEKLCSHSELLKRAPMVQGQHIKVKKVL